jgi:hypothetical protein
MKFLTQFFGRLLSGGGRSAVAVWGARSLSFTTKTGSAVGGWLWRAIDFASLGYLAYTLTSDDSPESISATNGAIVDHILNKPVLGLILTTPDDKDAIDAVFVRTAVGLQGGHRLAELHGLSLLAAVAYTDRVQAQGLMFSLHETKEIFESVAARIGEDFKGVLDAADLPGAKKEISDIIDSLDSDKIDFVMRKNIDYLAFFFELMAAEMAGDQHLPGVDRIINPFPGNQSNFLS